MSESPHKRARLDSPPRGAAEAASSSDDDAPAPAPALAPAASPPLAAVEQAPADAEAAEQAGEGAPAASGGDDGSGGEDDGSSSSDEDALPAGGPTTWEWNDSLGDAADVAHIGEVRREYAERMAALISRGNAKKPDMQVVAAIRKDRGIPVVYGHVKGVRIGARFAGRGELAACGLHLQICRGIDARARAPASCVVIAGGYGDDKDKDDEVEYTGEGGRCETSKKQIKDQVLTGGNASLALNHATGCPVRVVRGALQPDGGRVYIYDGLYRVESCEKRLAEGSTCRVWIFHLRSLARHSRAAETRVAFRALQGTSVLFRNAAAATPRAARQAERAANPPRSQQAEAARLNVLRRRPGLLAEDISGGAEAVAIPVFCEIPPDDAAAAPITAESALPPGFRYIRHCAAEVSALAAAVAAANAPVVAGAGVGSDRVVPAAEAYVDGPYLQATEGGGILEESADEAAGGIVSAGIALPLEIFRCAQPGKGWGVRCAVPILEGEFICEYAGEARTAAELEAHHDHEGSDSDEHHAVPALSESYVFELNHFNRDAAADAMLCVDAYSAGNVARFINAAPGGDANVVVQHVFTRAGGADRRAFHRTALFAQCYIEPFTELCYDYGPAYPTHWAAAVAAADGGAAALRAVVLHSADAAERAAAEEAAAAAVADA